MSTYTEQTLSKGEHIRMILKPTQWEKWCNQLLTVTGVGGGVTAILAGVDWFYAIPACFFGLVGGIRWINYYFTEYALTDKKVLSKTGIISRSTDELQLSKLEGVDVRQGIVDRLMGVGTLVFSGTGTQQVEFTGIDNPIQAKQQLEQALG